MRRFTLTLLLALTLVLPACSDDSDDSDEASTCSALQDLSNSVAELVNADVISGGTDEAETRLDAVQSAYEEAKAEADEQFGSDLDALEDAVNEAISTVQGLGDAESLGDAASQVGEAITAIEDAWSNLSDAAESELADCDLTPSSS